MKTRNICGTSSLFVSTLALLSSTAFAQEAATTGKSSDVLEEVIVTANKREEKLQTVPASIVAVTADMMEKQQILEIKDFQHLRHHSTFRRVTKRVCSISPFVASARSLSQWA